MSIPFFYEPFDDFNSIELSENTIHHATHVLRMKEGMRFKLTNGIGKFVVCEINQISKKQISFTVIDKGEDVEIAHGFHLAIAFTKTAARIEWLLEKITEIGVKSITPLLTERSERNHYKKERLEKILVSAMLQSQQVFLPELNEAQTLTQLLASKIENIIIAHCDDNIERIDFANSFAEGENVLVLIGPEGDFSPKEIQQCLDASCKAVSFGKNRLRTETAGLFACAVYHSKQN